MFFCLEGPVSTEENFEASQICIPTNYDLNNVCRTCGTRQTFKWTVHDKLETIPIKTMLVECFEPTQVLIFRAILNKMINIVKVNNFNRHGRTFISFILKHLPFFR